MTKRVIFDTNILMGTEDYATMVLELQADELIIGFETLEELDNLKTADGRKGAQARRAVRNIRANLTAFTFVYCDENDERRKVDDKIVLFVEKNPDVVLVTNDIAMQLKAHAKELTTENYYEESDVGTGWHKVELSTPEGSVSRPQDIFPSLGEYVEDGEYIIFHEFGLPVSIYVKDMTGFHKVESGQTITPGHSEQIKPRDPYQSCAFDSLIENDFSIITGPAGSGKTLISISRMLEALETGEVDKIVIFTNPTKARGSEQLGFYSGDRNAKLLQNSIGAILISKLGSITALEEMIALETLVIMPMSDIRGYEVPERAYLYISEAQNATADLLQLAIQRASGGPIIIEGDPFTQLDHWSYGGESNGMLKAIEVFKGFDGFAHIHLPIIYRSKIAERAELMTEHS